MAIATCINNFWYHDYIEEGKEYRVLSVTRDKVEIDIDNPFKTFPIDKFTIETNHGNHRSNPRDDDDEDE